MMRAERQQVSTLEECGQKQDHTAQAFQRLEKLFDGTSVDIADIGHQVGDLGWLIIG